MSKPLVKTDVRNTSKTSTRNKKTSSTKKTRVINIGTGWRNEIKAALRKKSAEEFNARQEFFARNEPPINEAPIPSEGGRFQKGVSGNPAGRPLGSRNKTTLAAEQLLAEDAEELTQTAIELGKNGNVPALRLCLERVIPVRKERTITFDLRSVTGPDELPVSFSDIMTAVAEGRITPREGSYISDIITAHTADLAAKDHARRLQANVQANADRLKEERKREQQRNKLRA